MNYLTENPEWVRFYAEPHTGFFLEKAGYFDERPQLHTSVTQLIVLLALPFLVHYSPLFLLMLPFLLFGYGALYINLPIRTGIQDCASAAWGVNYHDSKFWVYIGGGGNFEGGRKWKTFRMPWGLQWYRTSHLLKVGWFLESKKSRIEWRGDEIGSYNWLQENRWKETHPFVDKYDGSVVNATISVEEMEWRPYWFMWTSLFSKVRRSISVEFDKEVGKRKGSWKGGVIGCGYDLRPDETPYECLKRMENERDF